jgi:hypothetical protein
MSISSKTRGLLGSGANPAAPNENEICRYTIFERRALRSRHEAIYLPATKAIERFQRLK